jgi:hypothetical protein
LILLAPGLVCFWIIHGSRILPSDCCVPCIFVLSVKLDEQIYDRIPFFVVVRTAKKGNELKKRKHFGAPGPFWWKLGSKRLLYEAVFEGRRGLRKIKVTEKRKTDAAEQLICDVAEA